MIRRRARHGRTKVVYAATVLTAIVAVAAAVALTRGGSSAPTPTSVGARQAASSGSTLALSGTDPVTGKQISLASYAGKAIVLNIWSSSCGACIAEGRALARFERNHPEAQVVGIDLEDTRSGAKSFYRRVGWRHPSISDPNGELAARLRVQALPTTIFLDPQHRVVRRINGQTNLAGFTAGLKRALA